MERGCVLLLSDDLLDASKTLATGRARGIVVRQVRSLAELVSGLADRPAGIILDLHFPGLDLAAVLERGSIPRPVIIAYGSHVDAERLRAARAAGCDRVMPRSQYFGEMEERLIEWLSPDPNHAAEPAR